jgi:sterol desaturase/sphingolipid hydroxylase (fatty acid hydroxylase superfamily)
MTYDWTAGLVLFLTTIAVTRIGNFLAFRHPALQRMRLLNAEMDAPKLEKRRYQSIIDASTRVGLVMNLVFFLVAAPFVVNLAWRPLWQYAIEIVSVLMVFDFLYYLTHRFLFHGPPLRKIHAVHHEVRRPSYVDALYVHPAETAIGLLLYMGSALLLSLFFGPFSAVSVAIATVVFTQINTINHTYVELPYFPFKTLDYITTKHGKHHENMDMGNYATLTMTYDYLFGTLE